MKQKYVAGSGYTRRGQLAQQHSEGIVDVLGQDKVFDAADPSNLKGLEKDAYQAWKANDFKTLKEKSESALKEAAPGQAGAARRWLMYAEYKLRAPKP